MNEKEFEKQKRKSKHIQKEIVKFLHDEKTVARFDTKSVTVVTADGVLMNVDPDTKVGRLLFYYHLPVLNPIDEKHDKKQLMNRCTVEIRMSLGSIIMMANSILDDLLIHAEKKQASMHAAAKPEKTESPMFG